ncbi:MAG TPA: histidine kinase [Bryobacteraceae bacterium]|jgi:two-component system sensor histidine kinase AlgZ|nr:histidine kinase [Bryobacteraceae bacterium]
MHPLIARPGRLSLYLLAWTPLALLLAYLLAMMGGLAWLEAVTLSLPLALFYALICLAPWYMCRVLPLGASPTLKILGNHLAAAIVAALMWIVLAKGLAVALGHYFFARLNERFSPQLPLLFGIGVLLYLLSVSLHYVLFSLESSKEAETREQEALTLARESELKALKAQINPHFLFNSLNSISALAVVDGQRARDMCIKLSDFLRTTLKLGEKQDITLADELALVKAYLEVEQVRFGARLRVEIDTDADCNHCVVPSLLLQPLVENAVKHGIAGLVEGGTIRVEAHCRGGLLQIKIYNQFDPDSPASSRHGLGLRNVRDRLRALYENRARVDTTATSDRFVVELEIPCLEHV